MEFRSDLRLTLKSSCDSCTSSKVKCNGEDPCSRCVKKGISCFYSPKKKRGPVKKRERAALVGNQPMVVQSALHGQNKQLSSLGSHERRSWSVFFTLYKHYAVSCSLFWFNRQLHKMRLYLVKQNKTDALKRLSSWMDALNIDEDELAHKVEACSLKIREWGREAAINAEKPKPIEWKRETVAILNRGSAPFHLRVNGVIDGNEVSARPPTAAANALVGFEEDEAVPYLNMRVDYTSPAADSDVHVNAAFEEFFGYGVTEIKKNLEDSGGGFLPWAADILSRVLVEESDLLSFVQIIAIKFNSMGKPTQYPIVRNVPSVHVFNVNHRQSKESGPVQCIIRCTHREFISDEESSLDVFMSFAPLESMGSLGQKVRVDREIAILSDDVRLPPKRAKRVSHTEFDGFDETHEAAGSGQHLANEQSFPGEAGAGPYLPMHQHSPAPNPPFKLPADNPEDKGMIYDYNGFKREIADASLNGESLILPPTLSAEDPNSQLHDLPLHEEHQQHQQLQQTDEASWLPSPEPAQGASYRKDVDDDGSAVNSPDPNAVGTEEDLLESLPFVDSSDEEEISVNADDGDWLDELLRWTGPALAPAEQSA